MKSHNKKEILLYTLEQRKELFYSLNDNEKLSFFNDLSLSQKEAMSLLMSLEEQKKYYLSLTNKESEDLFFNWDFNARPKQKWPISDWETWVILAGRGFGKTRTGAELVKYWALQPKLPNEKRYVNLMGATMNDAINIMVKGESGILNICSDSERPDYKNGMLIWPNGTVSLIFSAEEPERLRGNQHHKLWCDELGAWRYKDSYDQAMFCLRLGDNPQCVITTTPRPTELLKDILKNPKTIITRGSTYENAGNLASSFINSIIKKYEGTRLGRQELDAEMLDQNENALFNLPNIDFNRVKLFPEMSRIVVAIDPAVTANQGSDMTGIVVVGKGINGHYYVLEDQTLLGKPIDWARMAISLYRKWGADRIIGEVNNGGDMIEATLRNVDYDISYKAVRASKNKVIRAEPVASLYERDIVHHVGSFKDLEDQMCEFTGSDPKQKSPDRLDALVWGITELSGGENGYTEWMSRYDNSKEKDRIEMEMLKLEQETGNHIVKTKKVVTSEDYEKSLQSKQKLWWNK